VIRELALSVAPGEVRGALLEDGIPVELLLERDDAGSLVGAVFLGRVARLAPSLPGAFVELGLARPAFLPGGAGLVEGQSLLVRVTKDGFADKAPEVTTGLEFEGRWAVWTPARPGIAVSRRIAAAERARLSESLAGLVRPGEGVVLRSHAGGVSAGDLAAEVGLLRQAHGALLQRSETAQTPSRLDPVEDALRRIAARLDSGIERIVIDDRAALARLRSATAVPIEFDGTPGFAERHGLADSFEAALAVRLPLEGGGDVAIEETAAFTAIDVNLGTAASGRDRAAQAILAVNLAAASLVARQLRLRNIGGAVVVDFISMASREHRRMVEAAFVAATAADPRPAQVLGWTRLGHLELTRRRTSPSIGQRMLVPAGGRRAKSAETVALELLRLLAGGSFRPGRLTLHVQDSVAAQLTGGLADALAAAATAAGRTVSITVGQLRDPETFDIAEA
jgi:ribonuclease G